MSEQLAGFGVDTNNILAMIEEEFGFGDDEENDELDDENDEYVDDVDKAVYEHDEKVENGVEDTEVQGYKPQDAAGLGADAQPTERQEVGLR